MIELGFTDLRSSRKTQLLFTGEEIEAGEFEKIKNIVRLIDVKEFHDGAYYIVHIGMTDANRERLEAQPFYHFIKIGRHKRGVTLADIIEIKQRAGV